MTWHHLLPNQRHPRRRLPISGTLVVMPVSTVADSWVCAGADSPNHLASQANHQEPGLGVEPDFPNVCKHFMKGSCRFGLSCRFSHDVNQSGASNEGPSLVVVGSRSSKPWPRQEKVLGSHLLEEEPSRV